MADEEKLNLEDVGAVPEEMEAGKKKTGLMPAIVIKILQYSAVALGIILLGGTTAVITVNILSNRAAVSPQGLSGVSPQYQAKPDAYEYYDEIENIRGSTSDKPSAMFMVRVSIGYTMNDRNVQTELGQRRRQIQDQILTTISRKKVDQLQPVNYDSLKEELKQQINRLMKNGTVKEVTFREFTVTEF